MQDVGYDHVRDSLLVCTSLLHQLPPSVMAIMSAAHSAQFSSMVNVLVKQILTVSVLLYARRTYLDAHI